MEEIWIKSDFANGNYEFSNLGRVRNTLWNNRIVRGVPNSKGYLRICNTSTKTRIFVHKEVARLFLGECPQNMIVNHIDGNPLNNNVNNLEYVSRTENVLHAISVLHKKFGSKMPVTIEVINSIVNDFNNGVSKKELAEKYKLHICTIQRFISKKQKSRDNQQPSHVVKYGRFNDQ